MELMQLSKNVKIIIAAVVAVVLVVAIVAGSNDTVAYSVAKNSYSDIDAAYDKVNEFSHDIYEAWYNGINSKDQIKGKTTSGYYYKTTSYDYMKGLKFLAEETGLPFEDLKKGVIFKSKGEEAVASYTDKDVEDAYETMLSLYEDEFSACVAIITATYEVTGRTKEIETLLSSAKASMKSMSKKHADYVHYPDLKNYLTNTLALFDFCCNPEGSFEQVVETFNQYRNQARQYYFSLDYIFNE